MEVHTSNLDFGIFKEIKSSHSGQGLKCIKNLKVYFHCGPSHGTKSMTYLQYIPTITNINKNGKDAWPTHSDFRPEMNEKFSFRGHFEHMLTVFKR